MTKLNPPGTALVYSTYLGGSRNDTGLGIALDALPNPNAYVTGSTYSGSSAPRADFPTTPGAFQTTSPGGDNTSHAFVAKVTNVAAGPQPTTLTFTAASATTSDFDDAAQVQAKLTTTTGGVPVPNETVTFTARIRVGRSDVLRDD